MARTLIFTFDNGDDTYINVYADNDDPSHVIISRPFNYLPGQEHYPTFHEGDIVSAPTCQGTTQTYYTYKSVAPNAEYHQIFFSPYCGFTPPVCDLALSTVAHTDETNVGANDGTVNVFFTSSHLPIVYDLVGAGVFTNTTGYFTGIHPGTYHVETRDAFGCTATTGNITVLPFDTTLTRCKYRLRFSTVKTQINYELRFLYQKAQFDPLVYPLELTGSETPVKRKTTYSNEDKTEAINPSSLTIGLEANNVFDVDEFADAQERDWKMELYKNGALDWQGWLLPDTIQDFYADPNYIIEMTATDGLLSLKGGTFADQSLFYYTPDGIKRYVQLFGLKNWIYLVKICLDQLGYDYGDSTILSSLTYQYYRGASLWGNISTWSDLFYDENNEAKSTYDALEILLQGVKLSIFQEGGSFKMVDNNDMYWLNSRDLSLYCFLTDLDTFVNNSAPLPGNNQLGSNQINRPTNPMQTLNYDSAFNRVIGNVNFNLLSLLYPNPSFELNSVQGHLPDGFTSHGTINDYVNYDPQDPLNPNMGAYSGDWELKCQLTSPGGNAFDFASYIEYGPIVIDQPGKKINMSYYWRGYIGAPTEFPNTMPIVMLVFVGASGQHYSWFVPTNGNPSWFAGNEPLSRYAAPNVNLNGDFIAWNNYSITTAGLPQSSGNLYIRIFSPTVYEAGGSGDIPAGTNLVVDIDNLIVTQSDSADQYNFQKGETHTVTNITTYAKSEKKDIDLQIYTYPSNKRVSGNVSYGDSYAGSLISNEWFFGLSVEQVGDRLPANIIRRFAKNYQRPMYKWQGDIITDTASFYGVWILKGYESKVFIAFTLEHDLRNSLANLVLIEVDDTQMQSIYQYLAIYEKSARNNLS